VREEIKKTLSSIGIELVELSVTKRRGGRSIKAVVYKRSGTGLEECAAAHRAIAGKADEAYPDEEVAIEVSSPGLERIFSDFSEFAVFAGRGVKVMLLDEGDEWVSGIIRSAEKESFVLGLHDGRDLRIPYDTVRKAKLDYSQEGDTHHVV
jgi:ribosome maturation factor RimP